MEHCVNLARTAGPTRRELLIGAASALLVPAAVRAQAFPSKPLRVIAAGPAGRFLLGGASTTSPSSGTISTMSAWLVPMLPWPIDSIHPGLWQTRSSIPSPSSTNRS